MNSLTKMFAAQDKQARPAAMAAATEAEKYVGTWNVLELRICGESRHEALLEHEDGRRILLKQRGDLERHPEIVYLISGDRMKCERVTIDPDHEMYRYVEWGLNPFHYLSFKRLLNKEGRTEETISDLQE